MATAVAPLRGQDTAERLARATEHMNQGRLDRALREVAEVLRENPASSAAWKVRGEIHLRRAHLESALTAYQEASRLDPSDVDVLILIGDLLVRRSDRLEEALQAYTHALALSPENDRVLISMGSIHERREEWERAAARYRQVLQIDPNNVRARSSLGAVLFKTGQYEEASDELRKAIELSPRDLRSRVFLGMSLNHLGRYEQALQGFKDSLLIDPHAANQMIGVREQRPQFERLTRIYAEAYDRSPREAGRSFDLAVIYYYAHDYDSAWKFLVKAENLRYPIPIEFKEVVYARRRTR